MVLILNLGIKDRVAIVTGSSQGIGKSIAYTLAKEGAKIVICARNKEKLLQVIEKFRDAEFGNFKVDSIKLKKSEFTQKGPIYTTLKEVKI